MSSGSCKEWAIGSYQCKYHFLSQSSLEPLVSRRSLKCCTLFNSVLKMAGLPLVNNMSTFDEWQNRRWRCRRHRLCFYGAAIAAANPTMMYGSAYINEWWRCWEERIGKDGVAVRKKDTRYSTQHLSLLLEGWLRDCVFLWRGTASTSAEVFFSQRWWEKTFFAIVDTSTHFLLVVPKLSKMLRSILSW